MADVEWEGPSLVVHQERNRLRKLSFAEVAALPRVSTATIQFRGKPVCVAVVTASVGVAVAVLVQGYIPGGGALQEASFVMMPDGNWHSTSEQIATQLRISLRDALPDIA